MWEVSTLEVLCPKHKTNLETEYITLTVLQQDYPVVIGHCPLCQSMYISKRLWFSDGRVKIEKHTYEYLNDLDIASQKEETKKKAEELQKRRQAQKELREKLIAERDRIQAAQNQREIEAAEYAHKQIESNAEKFNRGELLKVVFPNNTNVDEELQKHINSIKQQHISLVISLTPHYNVSSHRNKYCYVVQCSNQSHPGSIRIKVAEQDIFVNTETKHKIYCNFLKRINGQQIHIDDADLLAIEKACTSSRDFSVPKTNNTPKRRVKSSNLVPSSLAQRWISVPIQHKPDNVMCPRCQVLIPTRYEYVHIEGSGHLQIKVGYCSKCSLFYSSSDKTYEKAATLNGIAVSWSNLRYIGGAGNKIRFRKYARHTSNNLTSKLNLQKDTIINNTNLSNNTPKTDSNSIYDKIIKQLPVSSNNCPLCKRANNGMLQVKYQIYDSNHIPQLRFSYARHCLSCDIIFFDHGQEQAIKDQFSTHRIYTINASSYHSAEALMTVATTEPSIVSMKTADTTFPFEVSDNIRPNLSFEKRVILVYAKKCHCEKCFEKYKINPIVNRTAVVNTVAGKTVETNVMFCRGCGRYFMNHTTFEQYQKLYGGLLFEYRFTGELAELNNQYLNFAPDSILSRCGYNVRAGTSKDERQARLRYILETHKATKWELIELISGFISLRHDNPKFGEACARWQEDILYINQHKIESQKKVYGLSFKQGK